MTLKQDYVAGALFAAVGMLGLIVGADYDAGTLAHAGAGLAPKALCAGLVVLGAVISMRASAANRLASSLQWRPIVTVLGGLLLYAVMIERAGLAPTVAAMTVFMYFASGQRRWGEALVVGVLFGAGCTALFVWGLKLSFRPGWW